MRLFLPGNGQGRIKPCRGLFVKPVFIIRKTIQIVIKEEIISTCVKAFLMESQSYRNECVSNNILEKQDKFPRDKSVHQYIRFIYPLQILLKVGIKLCELVFR